MFYGSWRYQNNKDFIWRKCNVIAKQTNWNISNIWLENLMLQIINSTYSRVFNFFSYESKGVILHVVKSYFSVYNKVEVKKLAFHLLSFELLFCIIQQDVKKYSSHFYQHYFLFSVSIKNLHFKNVIFVKYHHFCFDSIFYWNISVLYFNFVQKYLGNSSSKDQRKLVKR